MDHISINQLKADICQYIDDLASAGIEDQSNVDRLHSILAMLDNVRDYLNDPVIS